MSEVKVNKISPRSGTTITLGDSGDTFTVPSGVTFDASSGGLAGTLTTAAQPNITSVGTLTSFTSTGIDDNATSTAITINSSEQVAIGTTSHTTGANLTLAGQGFLTSGADSGSIAFGSNTSYQGRIYQDNATSVFYIENTYGSGSGDIRFKANGSERVTIEGTGNVGIGTSSPSSLLHIYSSSPQMIIQDGGTHGTNSTPGLVFKDSSSSQGEIGFENSGEMFIRQLKNADMTFRTNNSERMRITSAGNILVGSTVNDSTDSNGQTIKGLVLSGNNGNGTYTYLRLLNRVENATTSNGVSIAFDHAVSASTKIPLARITASPESSTNGNLKFFTGSGSTLYERLRIDRSGRLRQVGTSNGNGAVNLVGEMVGTYKCLSFERTNSGGEVGSVVANTSSTSYNTSSDYRLKENVVEMTNATDRLKQLQPKRFNFIADADTTVDGFLAHEVSSIVPEAVTGTHNQVKVWEEGEELPEGVSVGDNKLDENGNTIPEYQGIDQSKLVPLLVKTIQELEARITTLENA